MATLIFDKFRKLSHVTVNVDASGNDTLVFDGYTTKDVKSAMNAVAKGEDDAIADFTNLEIAPSWTVRVTNFTSSDFMAKAREIYDGLPVASKLRAFASDFQLVSSAKGKSVWGVPVTQEAKADAKTGEKVKTTDTTPDAPDTKSAYQPIHTEEYISYGIHAHLEPLYKKTDALVVHILVARGHRVQWYVPEAWR
jgi:hypothetical protein